MTINQWREELQVSPLRRELEYLQEYGESWNQERIQQLTWILSQLKNTAHDSETRVQQEKDKLDQEMVKNMFCKPWRRLPSIHQKMRLQEYLKRLTLQDQPLNSDQLKALGAQLEQALEANFFKGSHQVEYDEREGKILALKHLAVVEGEYQLNWQKKKRVTRKAPSRKS